jgi:hypothetical protein
MGNLATDGLQILAVTLTDAHLTFTQCRRRKPLSFSHGDESGVPCLGVGRGEM